MILMQGTAVKPTRSKSVPKAAQAVYDAVVALTDAFVHPLFDLDFRAALRWRQIPVHPLFQSILWLVCARTRIRFRNTRPRQNGRGGL